MSKIHMTFYNGDIIYFNSVPELLEYICDNKLLSPGTAPEDLLTIWEHTDDQLTITSKHINSIVIRDTYSAEVCHYKRYTFHDKESFEDFMISMGATRGHIMTGARYGIYGGEIITRRYDCFITANRPNF